VTRGVPGAIEGDPDPALGLDGVTGHLYLDEDRAAAFDFLDKKPFTIECWARHDPPAASDGNYRHLFGHSYGVGSNRVGFIFYAVKSSDRMQFEYGWEGGTLSAASALFVPRSEYMHLVAVFDGTVLQLYSDGARDGLPRTALDGLPKFTARFVIGRDDSTTGTYWHGAIDELAIYDKALSGEAIDRHFRTGRP
jgi:hypothetical protein